MNITGCAYRYSLICIVVMSLVAGCSLFDRKDKPVSVVPDIHAEEYSSLKKLAVLPFYNITRTKEAGKIISDAYVAELFKSGKFRIEEPGNIRQLYIQESVDMLGELDLERLKILGLRLGVDGVIVGIVEEFNEGLRGMPVVSIATRLVDADTGRVVWSSQLKRTGKDYIFIFDLGEVRSATSLAQKMIREMIEDIEWK